MERGSSVWPGVLLGIGLGGFVDGILMHQVLQWHHMVSSEGCCPMSSLEGLEENTLADGIFHAVAWLLTLAGSLAVFREWRAGRLAPRWGAHAGALLAGWGVFNLLDSLNHFAFGLHHIRDDLGGPVAWDIGFLILGIVLLAAGAALARRAGAGGRAAPGAGGRAAPSA